MILHRTHGLFGICILIEFVFINIGDTNCFVNFSLPCLQYLYITFILKTSEMEAVAQLHVVIDLKREGIISFAKSLTQHYLYFWQLH